MGMMHVCQTPEEKPTMTVIERLKAAEGPDRKLDEDVARELGFRIAATTRGPHIMREGSVASWDLPAYTATAASRAAAITRLASR